jgi:DNA-3-methyladenine glycosylase
MGYVHKPKLKRSFYERDTLMVARELLGKRLVHRSEEGLTVGEIVETEAYIGPYDKASHAYKNKRTLRTEIQYGEKGYAYIYMVHRQVMFDITTGPIVGQPEVVLIRALRPIYGIELMMRRRRIAHKGSENRKVLINLCNGPGKLTQAMGIKMVHRGIDVCGGEIFIEEGRQISLKDVAVTPRINIEYAGEAKKYPWRFCVYDCPYVSKPVFRKRMNKSSNFSMKF